MDYVLPNCVRALAGGALLLMAACGSTPTEELAPVASQAVVPYGSGSAIGTPALSQAGIQNEFGETEFAPRVDVWPRPYDASAAREADDAAEPPTPDAPVPDEATPEQPAVADGAANESLPAPEALPETAPSPTPTQDPILDDPLLADATPESHLATAKRLMAAGQLDEARAALARVGAGASEAQRVEARRGGVAIYNLKRIRAATGAERSRRIERARKDLGTTYWGSLFS